MDWPIVTLALRKLQASYYKRLEREGHRLDDVILLRDGTFLDIGAQDGRPASHVSFEAINAHEVEGSVWDTPEAAWWRLVSHEVQALPRTYTRRRFLVAWASSGDVLNAARACGLTREAGRHAVRKFLRRLEDAGTIGRVN